MYCTDCRTASPEDATHCVRCGKAFFGSRNPKPEPSDGQPDGLAGGSARDGQSEKTLPILIAAGLVIVVAIGLALRGPSAPGAPEAGTAATTQGSSTSAPGGASGAIPANGTIAIPGGGGAALPNPGALIKHASDSGRMANAKQLQMVLARLQAENETLPDSLDAIPAGILNFKPDPAVYTYTVDKDGFNYRLEVALENPDAMKDDPNVQGGKYVYDSADFSEY